MADEKFTMLGRIKAKKGCEQALRKELELLVVESRKEPGNIHYDLYQALDDECIFMFHETWADQKAFDEHVASPYLQSFLAKESELLAEPIASKKVKDVE